MRGRKKERMEITCDSPPLSLCVQCTTDCDHSSPTVDGEHTCRKGGGKDANEERGGRREEEGEGKRREKGRGGRREEEGEG